MPFMILYGGELAFLFLGARVARWMWRSREEVLALWRDRHGIRPSGPTFTPDPIAAPNPASLARLTAPASRAVREPEPLQRAA